MANLLWLLKQFWHCLVQLPTVHHHLELANEVMCLVMLSCVFPVGFMFLIHFFVYIVLCAHFSSFPSLRLKVVCLHDYTSRGWKDRDSSRLAGDSFVGSSIWCKMSLHKQTSNCTDKQIFICSVMFYSSLNHLSVYSRNEGGSSPGELRTTEEWVRKRSVNITRTKEDSSLVSHH